MTRSHCARFFCAAVFGLALGLAPSSARAGYLNPNFQAAEISTLDLGSAGTSGLLEFNNTGLVITNVAACEYWHSNGNGTYIEYTGLPAFMIAVLDGYDNGSWEGHSGITGSNAITDPSEYCIAFAYASNLGYVGQTWGGIAVNCLGQQ